MCGSAVTYNISYINVLVSKTAHIPSEGVQPDTLWPETLHIINEQPQLCTCQVIQTARVMCAPKFLRSKSRIWQWGGFYATRCAHTHKRANDLNKIAALNYHTQRDDRVILISNKTIVMFPQKRDGMSKQKCNWIQTDAADVLEENAIDSFWIQRALHIPLLTKDGSRKNKQ